MVGKPVFVPVFILFELLGINNDLTLKITRVAIPLTGEKKKKEEERHVLNYNLNPYFAHLHSSVSCNE